MDNQEQSTRNNPDDLLQLDNSPTVPRKVEYQSKEQAVFEENLLDNPEQDPFASYIPDNTQSDPFATPLDAKPYIPPAKLDNSTFVPRDNLESPQTASKKSPMSESPVSFDNANKGSAPGSRTSPLKAELKLVSPLQEPERPMPQPPTMTAPTALNTKVNSRLLPVPCAIDPGIRDLTQNISSCLQENGSIEHHSRK
jgi:hypothetical protein